MLKPRRFESEARQLFYWSFDPLRLRPKLRSVKVILFVRIPISAHYSDEKTLATPSWEILESELKQLDFTSGPLLNPSGVRGPLNGAVLIERCTLRRHRI